MIYCRCQYVVALQADEDMRSAYPITRRLLSQYIAHACRLLKCEAVKTVGINGVVALLIDLCGECALDRAVDKIKLWTSMWITSSGGRCETNDYRAYWREGYWQRAISPEDKLSAINFIDSLPHSPDFGSFARNGGLRFSDFNGHGPSNDRGLAACHHIILIEYRGRMRLPLRWRFVLSDLVRSIEYNEGITIRECAAMRNHIHVLCNISAARSIADVLKELKAKIQQAMLANRHFRKFEGWYPDEIAFTVSDFRYREEEHQLYEQDRIHAPMVLVNEMSHLYRRLGISYFMSLN